MDQYQDAYKLINRTIAGIKAGTLDNYAPLLGLFRYKNEPLSLRDREPMIPFFDVDIPKRTVFICGRQVSKSWSMAMRAGIMSGTMLGMNSLIVEPRGDQKDRFNSQILAPLLKSCIVRGDLIDVKGNASVNIKQMLNGNFIMLACSYTSPDAVRGTSGVELLLLDESFKYDTEVMVYVNGGYAAKRIQDIKAGDVVVSFAQDTCLQAPVVRDASYHGTVGCYRVTTKSGRVLECTGDHLLPTNKGKKRLSEIVAYAEHSATGVTTSYGGTDRTTAVECHSGLPAGGWLRRYHQQQDRSRSLAARRESNSVHLTQTPVITRARYISSKSASESWLRGACSSLTSKDYKNISLVTCASASKWLQKQGGDGVISVADNGAGSTGLVVYGRWLKSFRSKLRGIYCDKRLHTRGKHYSSALVRKQLGDTDIHRTCNTLKYRKKSIYTDATSGLIRETNAADTAICTRKYGIQNGADLHNVRYVRLHATEDSKNVLLNCVCRVEKSSNTSTVLSAHEGSASCIRTGVEEEKQGQYKCGEQVGVCSNVGGKKGEAFIGKYRLEKKKRGRCESKTSCAKTAKKDRSGIYRKTKSGTCALLRKTTSRSGAVGETQETTTREGKACETKDVRNTRGLITRQSSTYIYDPITSVEYIGEHPVYDIEVLGTHNYILANGVCSYNCQDINPDFLPVLESVVNASKDYGFIVYLGTAKTNDDALTDNFNRSCQFHWTTKCTACNKYSIAAAQEQLLKMISDDPNIHGPVCGHCGKRIDTRTGFFVPAYPSRVDYSAGYHVPTIIMPFHHTQHKWMEILLQRREWGKTKFYNEVLGIPDDTSVKILTLKNLMDARNRLDNSLKAALGVRNTYDMVVLGVDWTGGGDTSSSTVVAAVGRNVRTRATDVLYIERLERGMDPAAEADYVSYLAHQLKVDLIAHDYSGAGWLREHALVTKHPEWLMRLYPTTYAYRPNAPMVTVSDTGMGRSSYILDRTKTLAMTMMMIKEVNLTLPWFKPDESGSPQLDFLAIVERHTESFRGSNIFLFGKVSKLPDDGAHAVNVANIALCSSMGFPQYTTDPRYNLSVVDAADLSGYRD